MSSHALVTSIALCQQDGSTDAPFASLANRDP